MDSLLQKFNECREEDAVSTERIIIKEDYDAENPFQLDYSKRDYNTQFHHMYQHRLITLRKRVEVECEKRWDSNFTLQGKNVIKKERVLDIQGEQPCWCVGTIYCEMKYKPNILEEVISDTYGAPDLVKSYADPEGTDEIMLEDESGRVLLVGEFIKSTPFITGTVVGLLGMEADPGTFQVLDVCYPASLTQQPLPNLKPNWDSQPIVKNQVGNKKVALISGLNINTTNPLSIMRLKLLQEYFNGHLAGNDDISKIGRLIICGNSMEYNPTQVESGALLKSLEELGHFLGNILQTISVTIMPGKHDPSDRSLPQQALNKALFKENIRPYFDVINNEILNLVTNPYIFNLNGWEMLTTSGQSIDDIVKYIIPYGSSQKPEATPEDGDVIEHRLDLMECTMKWQNIAPTAPDTLWSYPYSDNDPFILNKWPHLYVVGNQPDFGTRTMTLSDGTKIKMIALPEFNSTGKFVLLDLETLDIEVVSIEM